MPYWNGLYTFEKDGKYYLHFGEFTPEKDYHGEMFVIDWNDGTKDMISFDLYISWKKQNPTVHKNIYLNGEEVKDDLIIMK